MTPIHQSIPQESPVGNKRATLKHALIDVDICDKPKIKSLIYNHGQLGIWYLVRLIMSLSRSTDAQIEIDAAMQIAHEIGLGDKSKAVLDYLIVNDHVTACKMPDGKEGITQNRVIEDQEKLGEKQHKWKENKKKQRCPTGQLEDSYVDSTRLSEQLNTEDLNTESISIINDLKGNPPDDVTRSSTVQNKPPKQKFGEHVYLTQTEIDNYQNKFGTEFLDRCCEKLNAWIEQDPTAKRVKNGKNAGATFRAWVFNAVAEEQMRATRSPPQKAPYEKETNFERNLRIIREA